nr:MAG TPA: hypothetical protein [Inoviridae sp.]
MLNRPNGQKHINSRADNVERDEKIQNAGADLHILKKLIYERYKFGRNNRKIKKSNQRFKTQMSELLDQCKQYYSPSPKIL